MPKVVQFNREETLENVLKVFWEKGYMATSMQDIVDASGLNRSSIYNSFGSKEALYLEALKQYQIHQKSYTAACRACSPSAFQQLKAFFDNMIPSILDDKNPKSCFYLNAATELNSLDANAKQLLQGNKEQFEGMLKDLVVIAQAAGEIKASLDPSATAALLYNLISGIRINSSLNPDRTYLQNLIDTTFQMIKA